MNGVTLGTKHSFRDFKLILTSRTISLPEVQTSTVEVPGRDGTLDFSESLDGLVHYNNRQIDLTFESVKKLTKSEWNETLSKFASHLHGQNLRITFDDDSAFYYEGRCRISKYAYETATTHQTFDVICDCQPFKLELTPTVYVANINTADRTFYVPNGRKPVVPTIEFSTTTIVTMDGSEYTFPAGTYQSDTIRMAPGNNEFTARTQEDVGTITVTYTKGEL